MQENFNNNEGYKKVGPLSESESSKEYLSEQIRESERIENEIDELTKRLALLKDEANKLDKKIIQHERYIDGSTLYETESGGLVASLPETHPVTEGINKKLEIIKRTELLSEGLKNVVQAMRVEERERQPVMWNQEEVPEHIREVILNDEGSYYASWESRRGEEDRDLHDKEVAYIRSVLPDIFGNTEVPIDLVRICSEYDGWRGKDGKGYGDTGFSGVAVFTDSSIFGEVTEENSRQKCLVLVMKDGTRICLVGVGKFKTYPQITKLGPDFAGYGKTRRDGRFSFQNMCFREVNSSSSHYSEVPNDDEKIVDFLERLVSEGEIIEGIDPDTHYDSKTKCIVIDKPLFIKKNY